MLIVRYKNGTLYCRAEKRWLKLEDIQLMENGSYSVFDSKTKKDITAEVTFLAEVDLVRREGLWDRAYVGLTAQDSK